MSMLAIEAVRNSKELFMHQLVESEFDGLRIVLHEAKIGETVDPNTLDDEPDYIRKLLIGKKTIVHGEGCYVFELHWPKYTAYQVENEFYGTAESSDSIGDGIKTNFVEYSKSVRLDHVIKTTVTDSDDPVKCWAIHCFDHNIYVIATEPPMINFLKSTLPLTTIPNRYKAA